MVPSASQVRVFVIHVSKGEAIVKLLANIEPSDRAGPMVMSKWEDVDDDQKAGNTHCCPEATYSYTNTRKRGKQINK